MGILWHILYHHNSNRQYILIFYVKNEALTIGLRFLFFVKRLLSLIPQQACSNFFA